MPCLELFCGVGFDVEPCSSLTAIDDRRLGPYGFPKGWIVNAIRRAEEQPSSWPYGRGECGQHLSAGGRGEIDQYIAAYRDIERRRTGRHADDEVAPAKLYKIAKLAFYLTLPWRAGCADRKSVV